MRASGIWFIDGIFGVFPLRCHVGSTKEGNCWRIRTDDSTAYTVPAIHEARIPIPLAPRSLLDKPSLSDVSKCSEVSNSQMWSTNTVAQGYRLRTREKGYWDGEQGIGQLTTQSPTKGATSDAGSPSLSHAIGSDLCAAFTTSTSLGRASHFHCRPRCPPHLRRSTRSPSRSAVQPLPHARTQTLIPPLSKSLRCPVMSLAPAPPTALSRETAPHRPARTASATAQMRTPAWRTSS